MYKTILREIQKEAKAAIQNSKPIKLYAEVEASGQSSQVKYAMPDIPISIDVLADFYNPLTRKSALRVELLVDTGCQFALVLPTYFKEALGLDESTLVEVTKSASSNETNIPAESHQIFLRLGGVKIQTTATFLGGEVYKPMIGNEILLRLFDITIDSKGCSLKLKV